MSKKAKPDWLDEYAPGVYVTPPCQGRAGKKQCGWPSAFLVRGKWYCSYCVNVEDVRHIVWRARRAQRKALGG